jgi:hypothetical protein
MSMAHAIAQLRHLYAQMIGGYVTYPAEAAKGILAPVIAELERIHESSGDPVTACRRHGTVYHKPTEVCRQCWNEGCES